MTGNVSLSSSLHKPDLSHVYGVVLAGGSGERLWPLSRKAHPKQLLAIDSHKSLVQQAVDRLALFIPQDHIYVSTTQAHKDSVHRAVGNSIGGILIEDEPRNTGPALILSCLTLYEQDPEACLVFVPSDSYIPEEESSLFAQHLATLITYSQQHPVIALCGIKPTYPATGYGYIAYGDSDHIIKPVLAFKEKPTESLAQRYVASDMMLWNSGIFCAQASVLLRESSEHAPLLYEQVVAVYEGRSSYAMITPLSIDYAVLEKSSNCVVLPATFTWRDIGNLSVFLSLQKKVYSDAIIAIDAHNNLVQSPHKVVALIGVDDLCVVETETALVICKQAEAEKINQVVQQLKKSGMTSSL